MSRLIIDQIAGMSAYKAALLVSIGDHALSNIRYCEPLRKIGSPFGMAKNACQTLVLVNRDELGCMRSAINEANYDLLFENANDPTMKARALMGHCMQFALEAVEELESAKANKRTSDKSLVMIASRRSIAAAQKSLGAYMEFCGNENVLPDPTEAVTKMISVLGRERPDDGLGEPVSSEELRQFESIQIKWFSHVDYEMSGKQTSEAVNIDVDLSVVEPGVSEGSAVELSESSIAPNLVKAAETEFVSRRTHKSKRADRTATSKIDLIEEELARIPRSRLEALLLPRGVGAISEPSLMSPLLLLFVLSFGTVASFLGNDTAGTFLTGMIVGFITYVILRCWLGFGSANRRSTDLGDENGDQGLVDFLPKSLHQS